MALLSDVMMQVLKSQVCAICSRGLYWFSIIVVFLKFGDRRMFTAIAMKMTRCETLFSRFCFLFLCSVLLLMQIVHYLVHWVAIGHASGFSLSILLLWCGNPTCPAGKQLAIKIENYCTSSMASNCSHHERDKDDDNNSGVAYFI